MPEHAARRHSVLPDDGVLDGAFGRRPPRGSAGEDSALGAVDSRPTLRTVSGRQLGNFRGPQLLFLVAAVETMSRLTLLELAEPELRNFLVTVSAPEVYIVRLGPQVHEVAE